MNKEYVNNQIILNEVFLILLLCKLRSFGLPEEILDGCLFIILGREYCIPQRRHLYLTRLIFTCILVPSKSVGELCRWLCKRGDRCHCHCWRPSNKGCWVMRWLTIKKSWVWNSQQ